MTRQTVLWVLGAVLILGLVVRLVRLDLMLYDFDEGVASIYALQFVERGDFPLFGVRTSLGFYNPPLFIYLIAPAFVLSKSPVLAVGMLQLVNLAVFALLVFALWRRGRGWSALFVLVFSCLSPGPVYLTNRLWGHALIPFFSVATFLLLLACVEKRAGKWHWFVLPLVIAGAQQVHFSGALLGINAVVALVVVRARPSWKFLVAGTLLALSSYIPFFVHEYRTRFVDFRLIGSTLAGHAGVPDHYALWQAALHSLTDFGGATAFQENYTQFVALLTGFSLIRFGMAVGFLGAVAFAAIDVWKVRGDETPERNLLNGLALLWIAVPLAAFSLLRVTIVPAYWLIAIPGPWLLAGNALEAITNRCAVATRVWVASLLIVSVGAFLWYHSVYLKAMAVADANLVKYPSYRDQYSAVSFVSEDSTGREVQMTQNNGTDRIDYQLLYLAAMLDGNATRLRHYHNSASKFPRYIINRRPREIQGVKGWNVRNFGLLDVYVEPNQAAVAPAIVSP